MVGIVSKRFRWFQNKMENCRFCALEISEQYLGNQKYTYTNHYGGNNITYGFTSSNFSHTYREDSPVNNILGDTKTKELKGTSIASLEEGKSKAK